MLSKNLYKQNIKIKASRDAVGDALLELGRKNKDVVVLSEAAHAHLQAHLLAGGLLVICG